MIKYTGLFSVLLRTLTVEEIQDLTTEFGGDHFDSLTELLSAKIESEETDYRVARKVNEQDNVLSIAEFKQDKLEEDLVTKKLVTKKVVSKLEGSSIYTEHDEVVEEVKVNTNNFILHQKRRLEDAVKKLKQKQILKMYHDNSVIDIEQERKLKDDLGQSSKLGILLNKRQY